jgi:hypothetical protein
LTGIGEMTSTDEQGISEETIKTKDPVFTQSVMRSSNIIEKPIEKVVLLFSDGSFIDYNKK